MKCKNIVEDEEKVKEKEELKECKLRFLHLGIIENNKELNKFVKIVCNLQAHFFVVMEWKIRWPLIAA